MAPSRSRKLAVSSTRYPPSATLLRRLGRPGAGSPFLQTGYCGIGLLSAPRRGVFQATASVADEEKKGCERAFDCTAFGRLDASQLTTRTPTPTLMLETSL